MFRKLGSRHSIVFAILIVILLAVTAACSGTIPAVPATAPANSAQATSAPTSASVANDEWVVAVAEEAVDLNPHKTSTLGSEMANRNVLETLLDFEGPNLTLTPKLAESWESDPDGKTWTFHLRKGVKFTNGEDFNADSVKFSFGLYFTEGSTRYAYFGALGPSIEIIDPYTVKLTLKEASPVVLANMVQFPMLPPKGYTELGDEGFGKTPIGTGPYKLVEWRRNEQMVFEQNENYWGPKPTPRRLILRPIKEASTRVAELLSGGVDIAVGIPLEQLKDLQSRDEIAVLPVKGARQIVYPFYQTKKPFDDVKVRQALNLAVDRNAIINQIIGGYAKPLNGPNFAPGTIGYDAEIPTYPYDPEKAKALLTEAGYPNGFEATWDISSGSFLKDKEVAEAVAGQLSNIGVKLNLRVTERPKLVSGFITGDWAEMTSTTWGSVKDPDVWLSFNMLSRKSFVDQKAIDLLLTSKRTLNPGEREAVLRELNKYLHDNPVWLYVYAPDDVYAANKNTGWAPYALRGDLGYTYFWVPGSK